MLIKSTSMKKPWNVLSCIVLIFFFHSVEKSKGQDYEGDAPPPPPPQLQSCNGVVLSYTFTGREKIYPYLKNASAQPWSFESQLTVVNQGEVDLKAWMASVHFQYNELLVSAEGATVVGGDGFPYAVGKNATIFSGYPMSDLKTAIETAGDETQYQVLVNLKGTMFGLRKGDPMPKSIKLVTPGYKCPAPKRRGSYMSVCCEKDKKFKSLNNTIKFMPRQVADLSIVYDVLTAYDNKYMAQVTIDNLSPLGRLDQWNLTWEWMRNEFIYSMKGAYSRKRDPSVCIYGAQGRYYQDFDFTPVSSCETKPIISDLPPEKEKDEKIGNIPYCCRNGTLLPPLMNVTKSKSIFQMEVFKLPPDLNRTAFYPPQNWGIKGILNPTYKCGAPIRIDTSEFPDPSGLASTTSAIASWQIPCNITRPKPKQAKCCVSYTAYYSDSAVPCPTCACGCPNPSTCNPIAKPMPIPPSTLLIPYANRTSQARAWAHLKGNADKIPRKWPCPDNCGVSLNWHVESDYKSGWTARITLFNWGEIAFADWFTAILIKKAFAGYENVYSFNGTKLSKPNNTIFMEGLPGLNYLMGEVNGTHPDADPRVPGKQQSVISFLKKHTPDINIVAGDGFPTKVIFNGEECALPTEFPRKTSGATPSSPVCLLPAILAALITFLLLSDHLS